MKRLLSGLTLTLLLVLTACQTPPLNSIEDVCGVSINVFKSTPAIEVFETSGLKRTSATLTGYFDTLLSLTLYTDESVDTHEILDCVEMIYKHVHQLATNYNEYDNILNVYQLNKNPGEVYEIDPLLSDIIALGLEYGTLTEGLFDISLGALINVWNRSMIECNEGRLCELPSEDSLNEAQSLIGSDRISLNGNRFSVLEGTQIDLGGVAKGYAASLVGDYLRYRGDVKGFLINAGTSNIEVYGSHPTRDNQRWLIALRHPESEFLDPYSRLYLDSGEHIVTAGDYQRYFEVDGERFHHIIDPRTLYPGQTMRSITLIGPDGILGDVLSTAAFLMEPLEAIAFAESFGFEAILYTLEGEILFSENLISRKALNNE